VTVDVGFVDLVRSYVRLREAAGSASDGTAHMLLFYGVECGLKAAYLGKRGITGRGTQDLPQELRNHDLRRLVKELRIDGRRSRQLLSCRRKHDNSLTVDHQDLHQAWRYGATLDGDDEKEAVVGLNGLSEWCRKEHNR
jgi:hypothetical protein